MRERLERIHQACMSTAPKQAIGEAIAAMLKMPEWNTSAPLLVAMGNDFVASCIPVTATILEAEGQRNKVCMTRPELWQFLGAAMADKPGDFAKIVRASDGAQVLFYKDTDDENRPRLSQVTEYDGITANIGFGFDDDDWDKLDKAFSESWVGRADEIRELVAKMCAQAGDGS